MLDNVGREVFFSASNPCSCRFSRVCWASICDVIVFPERRQLPPFLEMRHRYVDAAGLPLLLIVLPSRWKKEVRSYIARDLLADDPSLVR